MYLPTYQQLPPRRYFSAQTKKEPGPEVWMQGLRERICFLPGMQFACPSMHVEGDDVQALYHVGKVPDLTATATLLGTGTRRHLSHVRPLQHFCLANVRCMPRPSS